MNGKVPVLLRVPIDPDWDDGTKIQLYTNNGSGAIDTTAPLLAMPAAAFPDEMPAIGLGGNPLGATPLGSGRAAPPRTHGLGAGPLGARPLGAGQDILEVIVWVDDGFGTYTFGAEAIDEGGNVQTAALVEFTQLVSGEHPQPLVSFGYASYSAGTDQITFDFSL